MIGQPRLVLLTLVAAAVAAVTAPPFYVTLLSYIGLYSLIALGLVLLTGVGGLTSFGQAAFAGVGAYATAVLCTRYGWSPWATMIVGVILASVLALALGAITMRLAGHYLPLGTIAWGIGLYYLFGNLEGLGGHTGIDRIPPIKAFGHVASDREMAVLIWLYVCGALLTVLNLLDSRVGRAIRSLRGGAVMAEGFGVDTAWIKIAIFLYAGVLAAISGWLYAHLLRFVNPSPFSIGAGIEYIFMIVIGGAGYVWGAVLGAAALTVLRQVLQDALPAIFGTGGNYELIAFGVIIILLLQQTRSGLAAILARRLPRPRPPLGAAEEELRTLPRRRQPAVGQTILVLEQIAKRFGAIVAVNEVSFELRAGEILGLIGPNGAGKTTTFNLISAVLTTSAGRISFLGRRIERLPARKIATLGIARTFQHVRLRPTMSVIDNVALGGYLRGTAGFLRAFLRLDRAEERLIRAEALRQLERVGLADHALEPAGTLPLGKQRLLEIARALCADPVLLLLDEPAAGLRHAEKVALAEVLKQLRQEGLSTLMVEHDMEFVMHIVDRLVVMDFGRKITEGLPADVRNNPAVIEAYLGAQ